MFRVKVVKSPQRVAEYHGNSAANISQAKEDRIRWIGTGARILELSGACDPQAIARLASGRNPHSGHYLPGLTVRTIRRSCYDLLFAAPKSVSIAALVAGDRNVIDAHINAANTAFAEIERWITTATKRSAFFQRERPHNLVGVHVVHTHSRRGDPHLHSHILAFNVTYSMQQQKWVALDLATLLNQAQLFRTIYQHELAWRLNLAGYKIDQDKSKAVRIIDVPTSACESFSKGEKEAVATAQAHYGESNRLSAWGNERSREREKIFAEGYEHDRERWRSELTPQDREVISRMAENTRRAGEHRVDGIALVDSVRRELCRTALLVTPYKLALTVMEQCFGLLPWDKIREAVRHTVQATKAKMMRCRNRNHKQRSLATLPISLRPWDGSRKRVDARNNSRLSADEPGLQTPSWLTGSKDAIIAQYDSPTTSRSNTGRRSATPITDNTRGEEPAPSIRTRIKARL